jgi:hypothetical protein
VSENPGPFAKPVLGHDIVDVIDVSHRREIAEQLVETRLEKMGVRIDKAGNDSSLFQVNLGFGFRCFSRPHQLK